jgi:hypothetical protein
MNRFVIRSTTLACCLASSFVAYAESNAEAEGKSRALKSVRVARFKNVKSGLCLGVDHASTAEGARLKQFRCDNSRNQSWRTGTEPDSPGVIFANLKSNLCMGVDRASTDPDAIIGQYYCEGRQPEQKWITAGGDGDAIRIMNYNSRLCIGVDRASTAGGAQLKQFKCDNRPNQKWVPIFTEAR